jgi:hypothetical protein
MTNKKIPVFDGTEERQPETPLEQADVLLSQIRPLELEITDLEAKAQAEIDAVKKKYARIGKAKAEMEAKGKELTKLLKKKSKAIYGGKDLVLTKYGKLTLSEGEAVSVPKDALEAIKREGWMEAVRITEKIDKTVIEKWPDERLAAIGATRKPKTTYGWETNK